jgi:hypothetical protein
MMPAGFHRDDVVIHRRRRVVLDDVLAHAPDMRAAAVADDDVSNVEADGVQKKIVDFLDVHLGAIPLGKG